MLEFYSFVYRVNLLNFQKDGIVEIPFHDLLPFVDYHLVYDPTQGFIVGAILWVSKGQTFTKMKHFTKWSIH